MSKFLIFLSYAALITALVVSCRSRKALCTGLAPDGVAFVSKLDHVSFSVSDYERGRTFYDETLKILGIECLMAFDMPDQQLAGYGSENKPYFWIGYEKNPQSDELIGKARGLHVAFSAPNVAAIKAWHQKCLELGGKDNGAPGPRPEYHPGYYGAFIVDPDGWRIEAALHNYSP